MATHSSVLAWSIPGTGEPGGLLSVGSHRVGHDWSDLAAAVGILCNLNPSSTGEETWNLSRPHVYVHAKFLLSCLTLCDPMDCSLPGSFVDFPNKNTGVGFHFLLQGIFPIQGLNPCHLHCRQALYHWTTNEAYPTYMYVCGSIICYIHLQWVSCSIREKVACSRPPMIVYVAL